MAEHFHTVILGAGAAGLFAAAHTGASTLVIDHAKRPAEKVRISGGGRCNFTNLDVTPENYISNNKHFHKSALARYSQWDFLDLLARHQITWHEKTLGQLFCDGKSGQIVQMLLDEARAATLRLGTSVSEIAHTGDGFRLTTSSGSLTTKNLIVATGGKSIPKMGATGFAYDIARQFGLNVTDTRAALVPLTFGDRFAPLAGLATPATLSNSRATFTESLLFTHRGVSGPAVLQLSSYWRDGEAITVNLLPEAGLLDSLRAQRQKEGRKNFTTELARHLPAKLIDHLTDDLALTGNLADQSDARLNEVIHALSNWTLTPTGSEGYRTAEVTLGGVDTDDLSSKTMQAKSVPGLYFIGEAVDVTGWLGGYNFQWAWASAFAAATAIAQRAPAH
ncbi:MAG: NAD(P)/FAD-dependent oxidoreductase [Maritimibacter sp.]